MAQRISPDEARRRVLTEWRQWSNRRLPIGPHKRSDATAFYAFLQQDKPAFLTSLGSHIDGDTVHGWLFRNGEVID